MGNRSPLSRSQRRQHPDGVFRGSERRIYLADVGEHEEDERGVVLLLSLDEARSLAAADAFLVPHPPTPEDLELLEQMDAEAAADQARLDRRRKDGRRRE